MGARLQLPTRAGGEESVDATACGPSTGRAKIHKVFQGQLDVGEEKWAPPILMGRH